MREKILNLLDEKDFVSGEKISKKIGISRTAVWKQIESLKNSHGFEVAYLSVFENLYKTMWAFITSWECA